MNKTEQPVTPSARRKLIRGAFSVPAVLAVHNGSALAATSNNKSCAIKSIASDPTTPPQPIVGTGADGWTRAAFYTDSSATPTRWVVYSDLSTIAASKGVGLTSPSGTNTGYIQVIAGGTYTYGSPTLPLSSAAGSVALLFDNAGAAPTTVRIVGFIQPSATGFVANTGVVTTSCWSSLKP